MNTLEILGPPRPDDAQKVALIFHDRRVTYQQLRAEVSRLAGTLRERFARGDLLAIWLPNCPDLLVLYLACFKTGVVPMPLHQGMKWPEMHAILQHSRPKCLITSRQVADPHMAELTGLGPGLILIKDAATTGDFLETRKADPIEGGRADPIEARRADPNLAGGVSHRTRPENAARPGGAEETPLLPRELALILHTSGSHGHAKGVMLSRANIEHILEYRLAHTQLSAEAISVVASCLTQSVGFYQSLALLAAGGTIALLESYDIDQMVDCIHRHHPTHLIMVVDAFDRLLHHPAITSESFARLAFASVGADRVTARLQHRFLALTGRLLRVSYGLTESSWVLINPGDDPMTCLALGRPCPGITVKLLDNDDREVPAGEVGELCIQSPRTMLSYLHDDALTRAAFTDDGWLRSGDLAYQDADGCHWFAGRKKHLIVLSSGDNVSPLEVENVILSHPAVSNCAVVGMATPHGSEVPWAAVARADESLSEAALESFLRERLSDYKIPHRIVFVPKLPVGRSGKVHREEARMVLAAMI